MRIRSARKIVLLTLSTGLLAACSADVRPSSSGNAFRISDEQAPTTSRGRSIGAASTTLVPVARTVATTVAGAVVVDPGQPTPEPFRFESRELVTGSSVLGTDLYRNAPLIAVFVTPWCPVCIQEGPLLAAMAEDHPDLRLVFIHASGSSSEYLEYIDGSGLTGANIVHLDDTAGDLWRRFNVASQPSFLIVDRAGLMRSSTGALDEAGLSTAARLALTSVES